MQLQGDIKINDYSVIPHKIGYNELKQKKLLLSLSVFQDELESAIIDMDTNSVYATSIYTSVQKKFSSKELSFLLNDFIHRYHLHQISFRNVHLIYSSPYFALCPVEFYLPEKKTILLNYAHPVYPNEHLLTNNFENIKVLYTVPHYIYNDLLQLFPSAKFFHSATAMMNVFFYHPLLVHSKIWIHVHPNYIEIIAKNKKQFLFYNAFDIQTSLDILYYILFCIEQLDVRAKDTDVFLSGNISLQHSIFQVLQKYVHSVQLVHHHPKLHILPIEASVISNHHFVTFNHYLCVSFQENIRAEK